MVAREALTLAWEAMQGEIYRTAGSSAARARAADGADLPRHGDRLGALRRRSSATGPPASGRASTSAWSTEVLRPDRVHRT